MTEKRGGPNCGQGRRPINPESEDDVNKPSKAYVLRVAGGPRYFEQYQGGAIEEIDATRFEKTPEDCRFKLYTEAQVLAVAEAALAEVSAIRKQNDHQT